MSAETTVTTLTELVNTEVIQPLIMDYAIDAMVAVPLCRQVDLSGKASKVASFPIWDKDVGADITEATPMTNTALETLDTQVTAAQVGILREMTKLAARVNILGEGGMEAAIARDGGLLLSEMAEDDVVGLFGSITASVGTSGSDLTIANVVEALNKRRTNKARGVPVMVLDDQQMLDLTTAIAAASGQVFSGGANQSVLNAESNGIAGSFLGMQVRYTNLTDTANTAADVVGAILNTGVLEASIGFVWLWAPEIDTEINAANASKKYGITMAYGCGLINDGASVKIVTDA